MPKLYLRKKFEFDAAHKLELHPGKCKNLHGHTYTLELIITGSVNYKTGMIIDFYDLKKIVNQHVLDHFDHAYLNDFLNIPTAENLVNWIWQKLEPVFHEQGIELVKIKLWETPDSAAILTK